MPLVEIKDLRALLPPNARLMGLDHSKSALGIALADPALSVVTPLKTLTGNSFTENAKALAALIEEYAVGGLVVGLPLNMDGSTGPRAQAVRTFVSNLRKNGIDLPTAFYDERLSTFAADEKLEGFKAMKKDKARDAEAAAYILSEAIKKM